MNTYAIWVDLAPGTSDLELSDALAAFLDSLKDRGVVHSWQLQRRKFGFGPDGLGEFHVRIQCESLEQLDQAFHHVAVRDGETENLHAAVFSRVKNFKSALYRDFPDPVRARHR